MQPAVHQLDAAIKLEHCTTAVSALCVSSGIVLIFHAGNRLIIKLGDKEVEFNPDFKFYITTKLSNPHYTPEISTKAAIVNFAVKEQGLEAQLLGIVVRKERPELEEQKDKLVVNIAQSKKKLVELEDEILRYRIGSLQHPFCPM